MAETISSREAEVSPPSLESSDSRLQETFPVSFGGEAGKCFRIWIMNTLLSIATFGIYSAWAKVRMKRFMLGHTEFAGFSFDYHANPVSILLSRIVLVVGILLINAFATAPDLILDNYYPLVLALLIPPLFARGLAFNARYTSYRTIRFHFDRKLGEIYFCFVPYFGFLILALALSWTGSLHPESFTVEADYPWLILIALLVLSIPYFVRAFHRYRVNNHSLGGIKLSHHAPILPYYGALLLAAIAFSLLVGGILVGVMWEILWVAPGALVLSIFMSFVIRSHLTRLLLDNIRFEGGRVSCRLKTLSYAWMMSYTFFLTGASLWLLRPWSIVLRTRRLASATSIVADPEKFESIIGSRLKKEPAIGDAAFDSFDFDVGLV